MTPLETPRLRLRLLAPEDAPFILELLNEPGWLRFIGDRDVRTTEAALAYIEATRRNQAERGHALYLVERRADGERLGLCGLVARKALPGPDLGFAFLARHHGQGLATEAAQAILEDARGRLGLGRLLAITAPDNEASVRLLGRLGFREEGRLSLGDLGENRLFAHDDAPGASANRPPGGAHPSLTMRAAVIRRFGGPEELVLADMPRPTPGPNQVLVKVVAASINPVDFKIRQHGTWAQVPMPAILGYDAAGVVEGVGAGVTAFAPGDQVFYSAKIFGRQGTCAEYHVEDADVVHRKPAGLSFEEAAALPLAGCTALDAIERLRLRPTHTVLVHAGAGGVGSLAVQLARASGARVIATCRRDNFALVRSLGATVTIDYREGPFEQAVLAATGGAGVDAACDTVGGDTVARTVSVVRPHGQLASIVSVTGDLDAAFIKNLTLHFGFMERSGAKLRALATLVERGHLRPLIDSVIPLERIADGHRRLEKGGVRGKIVVTVSAPPA